MGESAWHRFGGWLERQRWSRWLVLRYTMTVTMQDGRVLHHYTNRINRHTSVQEGLR